MDILEFQGEFRWLSNFWPVKIPYDGITFPSAESAYQAQKFLDQETKIRISKMTNPAFAKNAGKSFTNRVDNWSAIKVNIMKDILAIKFKYRSELGSKLALIDGQIIEGNSWYDIFWGVCNGVGENMLGRILMEIRDKLVVQYNIDANYITDI